MSTPSERLRTTLACAGWEDHRLRGRSLLGELLGGTSFWGLWSLVLGGPPLTRADEAALDSLAVCITTADPRIPPMKLIRLLSAYGGVLAAVAGGIAYQEEAHIGIWTTGSAARDLVDLQGEVGRRTGSSAGGSEKAVSGVLESWRSQGRRPAGFGVPARPVDERVVALRRHFEVIGRSEGPFWKLARQVERELSIRRPSPLNIAGAAAAVCLDLGFEPRQIAVLTIAFAQHALVGNALEGADAAPELLRRLPRSSVAYVGPPPRRSPRAGGEPGA